MLLWCRSSLNSFKLQTGEVPSCWTTITGYKAGFKRQIVSVLILFNHRPSLPTLNPPLSRFLCTSRRCWSEWPTRLSIYINTLYTIHSKESKKNKYSQQLKSHSGCVCAALLSFPKAPKQNWRNPTTWNATTNRPSGVGNSQETFYTTCSKTVVSVCQLHGQTTKEQSASKVGLCSSYDRLLLECSSLFSHHWDQLTEESSKTSKTGSATPNGSD